MTTTILLVRHARTDDAGRTIVGWLPGRRLNPEGRAEAAALAARLAGAPVAAVYCSPLERARETAAPIAGPRGLEIRIEEDLGEVRFGEWTGRAFEDLDADPAWHRFNTLRSLAHVPGGETMLEVQQRAVRVLAEIRARHDGALVLAVTHGDVIRAALACYLGVPLDLMLRFAVDPASISIVQLSEGAPQVVCVNDTARRWEY